MAVPGSGQAVVQSFDAARGQWRVHLLWEQDNNCFGFSELPITQTFVDIVFSNGDLNFPDYVINHGPPRNCDPNRQAWERIIEEEYIYMPPNQNWKWRVTQFGDWGFWEWSPNFFFTTPAPDYAVTRPSTPSVSETLWVDSLQMYEMRLSWEVAYGDGSAQAQFLDVGNDPNFPDGSYVGNPLTVVQTSKIIRLPASSTWYARVTTLWRYPDSTEEWIWSGTRTITLPASPTPPPPPPSFLPAQGLHVGFNDETDQTVIALFGFASATAGGQYIDLSTFPDFRDFVSSGAIPLGQTSYSWRGVQRGLIHYARLTTLFNGQWYIEPTIQFIAPVVGTPIPEPPPPAPVVPTCLEGLLLIADENGVALLTSISDPAIQRLIGSYSNVILPWVLACFIIAESGGNQRAVNAADGSTGILQLNPTVNTAALRIASECGVASGSPAHLEILKHAAIQIARHGPELQANYDACARLLAQYTETQFVSVYKDTNDDCFDDLEESLNRNPTKDEYCIASAALNSGHYNSSFRRDCSNPTVISIIRKIAQAKTLFPPGTGGAYQPVQSFAVKNQRYGLEFGVCRVLTDFEIVLPADHIPYADWYTVRDTNGEGYVVGVTPASQLPGEILAYRNIVLLPRLLGTTVNLIVRRQDNAGNSVDSAPKFWIWSRLPIPPRNLHEISRFKQTDGRWSVVVGWDNAGSEIASVIITYVDISFNSSFPDGSYISTPIPGNDSQLTVTDIGEDKTYYTRVTARVGAECWFWSNTLSVYVAPGTPSPPPPLTPLPIRKVNGQIFAVMVHLSYWTFQPSAIDIALEVQQSGTGLAYAFGDFRYNLPNTNGAVVELPPILLETFPVDNLVPRGLYNSVIIVRSTATRNVLLRQEDLSVWSVQ